MEERGRELCERRQTRCRLHAKPDTKSGGGLCVAKRVVKRVCVGMGSWDGGKWKRQKEGFLQQEGIEGTCGEQQLQRRAARSHAFQRRQRVYGRGRRRLLGFGG